MKLKIGRIYLAKWVSDYKLDDPPDYYWFAIIYARRVDGGIIYLGVKTGMPAKDLDGIPHAFWFDKEGTSLDGCFKIYASSKHLPYAEGNHVSEAKGKRPLFNLIEQK